MSQGLGIGMSKHNHLVVFKSLASLAAMTDICPLPNPLACSGFLHTVLHMAFTHAPCISLPCFSRAIPRADPLIKDLRANSLCIKKKGVPLCGLLGPRPLGTL